jgi:hypothetical protein
MINAPSGLTLVSSSIGSVSLTFTGVAGVSGYDVYRSTDASLIGDKINNALIAEGMAPYAMAFIDDVTGSQEPPIDPDYYYYRIVSVLNVSVDIPEGSGDIDINTSEISLPSESLMVNVGMSESATPVQATLMSVEQRGNP